MHLMKTLIAATDDVIDPGGPIPGRAPVPLHVAVETEKVPGRIEADIYSLEVTGAK